MAIIMAICILVNWKSLGHLSVEASSPYSKCARLPLDWKCREAPPAARLVIIHGCGQTITAYLFVCVTKSNGIHQGIPRVSVVTESWREMKRYDFHFYKIQLR